jgi:NTE family protein
VIPADGGASGPRDPVARAARTITGRRVGLALGAGAARGLAHIGVLQAIDELGIDIDVISGCSIGSAIAAAYAAGYHAEDLHENVARVASRALRPTLPLHSFLSNRGIRDELERLGQNRRFEDLDVPLAIPAVDIFRRCEVTFTTGLVWPRILASMAIPGIYPPLRAGDTYLVDGSVLTPVPVRQCRDLGAGVVIGVRLTGARTSPRDQLDFDPSRPLAADTITRCFEIMNNRLSELSRDESDVSIEVMLERGGLRDFDRAREYADAGYAATLASRDALAAVLPYVGAAA